MRNFSVFIFCLCLVLAIQGSEKVETHQELLDKYTNPLAIALDVTPSEAAAHGEDISVLMSDATKQELGVSLGTKIASKIVTSVVANVAGSVAGAVLGGFISIMGFIGDAVQRDKCKLRCCPKKNLPSVWGCKYQGRSTCNGHYADYPGHGDHACWWNKKENRCEAGMVCRDKTFNGFALVGSVCPPCPKQTAVEPQ